MPAQGKVRRGGYATLSFIPTLATTFLGLGLITDWLLGALRICPVVKRIWTPSWTLFSGGWCLLLLAACYAVIDWGRAKAWSFPLVVIGMNSITAYCIAELCRRFVGNNLKTHLGQDSFQVFGAAYEPFLHGVGILLIYWPILDWMYRRKIFLRI
ncbi:MAG: hypothetical protein HY706_22510 [Candidatus Hydrogenedentes bacterium]|nr:hypothetical protein [Candidatus Hydrogenedentota bacterium]